MRTQGRFVLAAAIAASMAWSQQESSAERLAPQTRAGEIELRRLQKAAELAPETPGRLESGLNYIREHRVLEHVFDGYKGLRPRFGGTVTGSGFAVGPEYYRHDLSEGNVVFRSSARASFRKAYVFDTEVTLPKLARGHVFLDLYGVHRNYPHVDYYGPGADSKKSGRSGFLLEDTSFQSSGGFVLARHLRLGGFGRYLLVNIGPGHDDRFVSTDRIYTEATTPGIRLQSNFAQGGGFVQYDWRDNPGMPRWGGNYVGEYSTFTDVTRGLYSFDRVDLEAQQYIGFFHRRRVLVLRGRVQATEARNGNTVPFYLQPTLGGSDDLRGFRAFRFYDNDSMVLNAEYRWELTTGLDMALFADAGRVFHDWRDMGFQNMEQSYGFGFRFHSQNSVVMRVDTGFSREGFQIWFKFTNPF